MKGHGGKREGAGRPTSFKKGNQLKVYVSDDVNCTLGKYSKLTGTTKSDIVEMALHGYLNQNNTDFIFCPECHEPVVFMPIISGIGDLDCHCENCGKDFTIQV